MKNTTLAIIGGSQEQTYKKVGSKSNCKILFHNGKNRAGGMKKDFRPLVKKADCVVILLGAIGHVAMDVVKELCKETNTKIVYHNGFGASGAVSCGLQAVAG